MAKAKNGPNPPADPALDPLDGGRPQGVPPDGPPVVSGGDSAAPPPPHGKPKKLKPAEVAPTGLPRVCSPLDRVPTGSGAMRFKCRVANYPAHATPRYVLAMDEDAARACHTKAVGLDDYIGTLKAQGLKDADVEKPRVVVTVLPD